MLNCKWNLLAYVYPCLESPKVIQQGSRRLVLLTPPWNLEESSIENLLEVDILKMADNKSLVLEIPHLLQAFLGASAALMTLETLVQVEYK
jgi:hypothetical protein